MAAENGLDNEVEDIKQAEGSASCEGQDKEDAGIKDGDNAENVLEKEQEDGSSEAEDASESEESSPKAGISKKEKRFGRKKDKNIEKLEAKLAELEDKRVRQLAEFENFRKRSEKEKSQMFETGAKTVVEKILPVIDNFERGLAGVPENEKDAPFVQGVELVYKQLVTALGGLGVKPIEAVGQEFDPALHNAVMAVDDDTLESGTVAEEMQKGYMYKESVVRHSMVKVVN
ncbi:MAG: nucleotide exchange factor GrpE [Lachnospiraceae bacterium]|nr:nucleotide exchange factor GrpE [Lachnospiraceae bacterium]